MADLEKLSPVGGIVTVAVKGTSVKLSATSLRVKMFMVQADEANTGVMSIGDSNVDYSTSPQITMAKGVQHTFTAPDGFWFDLTEWYVDASVDGEKMKYLYWK